MIRLLLKIICSFFHKAKNLGLKIKYSIDYKYLQP